MLPLSRTLCLLSLLSLSVSALQVTPGSTCASVCLDDQEGDPLNSASSTTNATDIVCKDSEYSSTGIGTKFRNCTTCLQTSAMADSDESDVGWFLYNLRYAVDVCLFGFGDSTKEVSSPCDINYACQPLKDSLLDNNLNADNSTAYGYCETDGGAFMNSSLRPCMDCLKAETDQKYLVNFLTALAAGCQQKPAPGNILGLTGDLFSSAGVNITAAPQPDDGSDDHSGTTMTVGTIVGISVGAALLFFGAVALFIVYFRRQRNQNNEQQPPNSTPPYESSFISDHKKSNSFHSGLELPRFTQGPGPGGHGYSNSFSSNAEYYDKLEEAYTNGHAVSNPSTRYTLDPHPGGLNPASALPAHPAYIPRALSRQSGRTSTPSPTPPPANPSSTAGQQSQRSKHRPSPLQNLQSLDSIATKQGRDSYALQVYLNAAEDSATFRIPPPPPNPPSHAHPLASSPPPQALSPPQSGRSFLSQQSQQSQQSQRSMTSASGAAKGTMSSQGPGSNGTQLSRPVPPPPPPPASDLSPRRGIPHLSLPSVPRIRVPKKYSPPQIVVEGATPVDGPGVNVRDISGPMDHSEEQARERRFGEESFDPRLRNTPAPEKQWDRVVQQEIPIPAWQQHEIAIKSGKTELYG